MTYDQMARQIGDSAMKLSKQGQEMLAFQEKLAHEFGYKPIEPNLFLGDVRETYRANLPAWCKESGDPVTDLYTLGGTLIAHGYSRIVIGDYGAFVEITPAQIVSERICCMPGQEYRMRDERFANHVKYHWLTVLDNSYPKIYYQQKTVDYADYRPNHYYISPYELHSI